VLRPALQAIEKQASRSGEVIRRVRAFATRREQQRERVEVADMIDSVVTLVEADARRLEVRLAVQGVGRCEPVWVDRIQVEQVLLNLVRNAFDACEGLPADRRRVELRAQMEPERVRIEVIDRGRGFESEAAERLFEPFYSTKGSGMGMGLNISESLIEASGGRLEARPNAGPGVTLLVYLPLATERNR
jgi:C4-dicarboxylate-specific signal transduction histidine kinase